MCPRPLVNARQRNPVRRLAMLSPFNSIPQASLSFAFFEQGGRVRGYKMGRPSRRVKPAAAAVSVPEDRGVVEPAIDNQSGDIGTISLSCWGTLAQSMHVLQKQAMLSLPRLRHDDEVLHVECYSRTVSVNGKKTMSIAATGVKHHRVRIIAQHFPARRKRPCATTRAVLPAIV